ncbi:MAG: hypothetical protein P1U87_21570 [Verrucomicrobiales bacterium]|nr:hypothetical protein [Verrucomicrobiales bacterium]
MRLLRFPFCRLFLLGLFLVPFDSHLTQASDKQLLKRLGGAYRGDYDLIYSLRVDDPDSVQPFDSEGRVVVPKKKGKRLRGTISLGVGVLDFRQKVKRIRSRRSSATYRGRLVMKARGSDLPPWVGRFRARSSIKGGETRFKMNLSVLSTIDNGEDPAISSVLSGKYAGTR